MTTPMQQEPSALTLEEAYDLAWGQAVDCLALYPEHQKAHGVLVAMRGLCTRIAKDTGALVTRVHWSNGEPPEVDEDGNLVVARDSAAELKAAVRELVAFMEKHHELLAERLPSGVLGQLAHVWNLAAAAHDANLRRLAGEERG